MLIQPRPFGQVLSDGMNALARVWRPLLTTSLLVFVPAGIGSLVAFSVTNADEFLDLIFTDPAILDTLPTEVVWEMATPFFQALMVSLLLNILASLFVYLASHKLVALDAAGYQGTGREARSWALRRYVRALVASVVSLLVVLGIIFIASFAFVIPSVFLATVIFLAAIGPVFWLAGAISMWTAVVAVEDRGAVASLLRSIDLVRGRWWPTVGFLILVGLLGSVAVQLIQLVALPLSFVGSLGYGISLVAIIGIAAQGAIVAGIAAMYTVWYIDLRARREELLSDALS